MGLKFQIREKFSVGKSLKNSRKIQMVSLEFPKLENACHCNFGLLKIGLKSQIGKKISV